MSETSKASVTRSRGNAVTQYLIGAVVGFLGYLLVAYISAFPAMVNVPPQPFIPILIAMLAGASVFVGRAWPAIAAVSGALMAIITLFFLFSGISTTSQPSTLDLASVLASGAVGGYALIIGVVLVCAASVSPRLRRS